MTPPVQEHVLDAGSAAIGAERAQSARRARVFRSGDVLSLVDVWMLLGLLWVSRAVTGTLELPVAVFAAVAFALLLSPFVDRERLSSSALDDVGMVMKSVAFAYALASAASLLTGTGDGRTVLFVAAAAGPILVAGRAAAHRLEANLRKSRPKSRTLIVGGGDIARRVISTLSEHKEYGLEVVGIADDDPKYPSSELGARFLGGLADLPTLVATHDIEVVIVAFSSTDQSAMVKVIRAALEAGASVWVVPRFFELGAAGAKGDHLWGLPVMRLQPPARSRPQWLVKRALDIALAFVGVAIAAPVMGAIALAILIDSGKPILLRQQRVGLDGRPFNILKFRSMAVADESTVSTEWDANDLRVTKVGRFLRDTGLDELPQLFNVLKGEMSLVGPRPERPYFVNLFTELYPHYDARHRLPAGVTGWAQVHGLRGDTSIEERAAFDNYYIENWSLSQDLKILLRTLPTFVRK